MQSVRDLAQLSCRQVTGWHQPAADSWEPGASTTACSFWCRAVLLTDCRWAPVLCGWTGQTSVNSVNPLLFVVCEGRHPPWLQLQYAMHAKASVIAQSQLRGATFWGIFHTAHCKPILPKPVLHDQAKVVC